MALATLAQNTHIRLDTKYKLDQISSVDANLASYAVDVVQRDVVYEYRPAYKWI